MLQSESTSPEDKAEVESWMCMKAEADECIEMDMQNEQSDPAQQRQLHVIGKLLFLIA